MQSTDQTALDIRGEERPLPDASMIRQVRRDFEGFDFEREARIAGALDVEFVHAEQSSQEGSDCTDFPLFCLGVSAGPAKGQMEIDFGERRKTHSVETPGAFLNASVGDQWLRLDGFVELVFIGLPMSKIANLLETETDVLVQAFSPLHERVITDDPLIRPLTLALWNSVKNSNSTTSLYVDQGIQTLVLHTLTVAQGYNWGGKAFQDGDNETAFEKLFAPSDQVNCQHIKRALEYIEAHLGEPLNISELASVAGMNSSRFSRAFKSIMGEAAWAYVRRRRIEAAREMIENTSVPMIEIAYHYGFSSQAHMSSSFSNWYKISPSQARLDARSKFYSLQSGFR